MLIINYIEGYVDIVIAVTDYAQQLRSRLLQIWSCDSETALRQLTIIFGHPCVRWSVILYVEKKWCL
jgi:hypothetical protein